LRAPSGGRAAWERRCAPRAWPAATSRGSRRCARPSGCWRRRPLALSTRALLELGAALRRRGRRADARALLRPAADVAQRCGAGPLAERAHQELLACGARPRRLVLSGVDALTPSERRIAELAARGLANREIAQALFLTVRTVEMHLTGAYRKLGISSRRQLAAALSQSGA